MPAARNRADTAGQPLIAVNATIILGKTLVRTVGNRLAHRRAPAAGRRARSCEYQLRSPRPTRGHGRCSRLRRRCEPDEPRQEVVSGASVRSATRYRSVWSHGTSEPTAVAARQRPAKSSIGAAFNMRHRRPHPSVTRPSGRSNPPRVGVSTTFRRFTHTDLRASVNRSTFAASA